MIAVTGVNGFVGRHVVRELVSGGHRVIGVGRELEPSRENDRYLDDYFAVDLSVAFPKIGAVDSLIHLAGLAAVGPSYGRPQEYITANSSMVTNVCESLLSSGSRARILIVSSGALYEGAQELPLTEESRLGFGSPYAVSKAVIEHQAAYYASRGLNCVVARPFNHVGPGQGEGFLLPDLARAIRRRISEDDVVVAGNLNNRRDYTDVRDVARAYRSLVESNTLRYQIYNVCSGRSVSGTALLNLLSDALGVARVGSTTDAKLIRPNDAFEIIGDNRRISDDTGWAPLITMSRTVSDFVSTLG